MAKSKGHSKKKSAKTKQDPTEMEPTVFIPSHKCDNVSYRFYEAVDDRTGKGFFSQGYEALSEHEEGYCDERLRYLRSQPIQNWDEPHAKRLKHKHDSDCEGIYEIRFKAGRVQQRPMGYFGVRPGDFTIVLWSTHKDGNWTPRNFCEVSRRRWGEVLAGSRTVREIEVVE